MGTATLLMRILVAKRGFVWLTKLATKITSIEPSKAFVRAQSEQWCREETLPTTHSMLVVWM